MAVSTNPSRIGQANLAGDERALFLKVFSGMVMNTFEKELKTRSRHTIRSIANGKSAQFPVMGRAQADYHQVGENILDPTNGLLSNIEHAEKVINIDDKLLSAVAISDVDEAINHYDIRATYASEVGYALAERYDKAVLKVGYAAARSAATLTRDGDRIFGGTRIFSDAAGGGEGLDDVNLGIGAALTTGVQIAEALHKAKATFDKKNIPAQGRTAFVTAEDYSLLVADNSLSFPNPTLNQDIGGQGSYAMGTLGYVAGFEICMTNNLPNGSDLSADATGDGAARNDVFGANGTGYNGDFTNSRILCMHPSAVGTVELRGISTQLEWKLEYQTDLLVSKYLLGHGILRPEAAIEISDGNIV